MTALPTVLVSSVVRSSRQGESHGGVYLVDLEKGATTQVLDWDDPSIDWSGRGADRGLRGIAFHGDIIYLAASDEVFLYDRSFRRCGSIRSPYLKHCHEIAIDGDLLYLTSTGFDAVLVYDLRTERFVQGWHFRWSPLGRTMKRLGRHSLRPRPRLSAFDPTRDGGPGPSDTCHINNVVAVSGRVYCSGTGMGHLFEITGDELHSAFRIPYGTHNTRPFGQGALMNHTEADAVLLVDRAGHERARFELPRYDPATLQHNDIPGDHARQAFGRGLTTVGDSWIVAGSSPATVTVFDVRTRGVMTSVNLTKDVRNSVHGLEVWPYEAGPDVVA